MLCSVPDLTGELREIRRVLRPNGGLYFFEHVAAQEGWKRKFQNWLNSTNKFFADGCHLNRDISSMIQETGFGRVELEAFEINVGNPLTTPSIVGVAWV